MVRDITERVKVEQTLQERELQYRNIFESSLDGLAINNLNGQLIDFNPAMAHMHGYTIDEFRQIQPGQFIHPDSQPLFVDYMDTVRVGREYRCRAVDIRKDGSLFYVEVVGTPFTVRGQPHAFAIVRDINAQVEAEQLLEQRVTERTRELQALLDISTSVASTLELKPLLEVILDQLKELIDYRGAALFALRQAELVLLEYRGPLSGEQLRLPADWWMLNFDLIRRGELILIPDTQGDTPLARKYRDWAGGLLTTALASTRTMLAIPLASKETIIGVISLTYDEPNHFTDQQISLVWAIANQAAVALENARLFTEAQGKGDSGRTPAPGARSARFGDASAVQSDTAG